MEKKCNRQKELETADRERREKSEMNKQDNEKEIMANSPLTIEMPRKQ